VDGKPIIVSSLLLVKGKVSGLDSDSFHQAVDEAGALCPVSRLFAGVRVDVKAILEST
jgi:osmotically inducible protein OsmC